MAIFKIHEDDIQLEKIHPRGVFEELRIQAENTKDFNSNGPFDFSKIEYDQTKKPKVSDINIPLNEIERLVEQSGLIKYNKVATGYAGNHQDEHPDWIAYGNSNYALVIQHKHNSVTDLWFYNISYFDPSVIKNILISFGKLWDLLFMDARDILVELKDISQVEKYIQAIHN